MSDPVISTGTPRTETYTASGGQTAFPIPFAYFAQADVRADVRRDGETIASYAGGDGDAVCDPASDANVVAGVAGTMTLPACEAGDEVAVYALTDEGRDFNYGGDTEFKAARINRELSRRVAVDLELRRDFGRTLMLQPGETFAREFVKSEFINKVFQGDENGDPVGVDLVAVGLVPGARWGAALQTALGVGWPSSLGGPLTSLRAAIGVGVDNDVSLRRVFTTNEIRPGGGAFFLDTGDDGAQIALSVNSNILHNETTGELSITTQDEAGTKVAAALKLVPERGLTLHGAGINAVSVRSFGAVGDSGNNVVADTAAFIAALAYCGANFLNLFVPPGNYRLSEAVTVPATVRVFGESQWNTTIRTTSPTANLFYVNASGVRIENLALSSTVTRSGGSYIYHASGASNCLFRNLYTDGAYEAITLDAGGVARIEDVDLRNTVAAVGNSIVVKNSGAFTAYRIICDNPSDAKPNAHLLVNSSAEILLFGCDFIRAIHNLLIIPGTGDSVITFRATNTLFDTAGTSGIRIAPTGSGLVLGADFIQCWGSTAGTVGADLVATGSTSIDGVTFDRFQATNCGSFGIRATGNKIKNLRIESSDLPGCGQAIVLDDILSAKIYGNKIGPWSNNVGSAYGLVLLNDTDDVEVFDNDFTGSTTAPVFNTATGSAIRFSRNKGYDAETTIRSSKYVDCRAFGYIGAAYTGTPSAGQIADTAKFQQAADYAAANGLILWIPPRENYWARWVAMPSNARWEGVPGASIIMMPPGMSLTGSPIRFGGERPFCNQDGASGDPGVNMDFYGVTWDGTGQEEPGRYSPRTIIFQFVDGLRLKACTVRNFGDFTGGTDGEGAYTYTYAQGFIIANWSNVWITESLIHDCTGDGLMIGDGDGDERGFVALNHAWENGDYGIGCTNNETEVVFSGNICRRNRVTGLGGDENTNIIYSANIIDATGALFGIRNTRFNPSAIPYKSIMASDNLIWDEGGDATAISFENDIDGFQADGNLIRGCARGIYAVDNVRGSILNNDIEDCVNDAICIESYDAGKTSGRHKVANNRVRGGTYGIREVLTGGTLLPSEINDNAVSGASTSDYVAPVSKVRYYSEALERWIYPDVWIAYTPTVAVESGTLTSYTATGEYFVHGKRVDVRITVDFTLLGSSPGGAVRLGLPTAYDTTHRTIAIGRNGALAPAGLIGEIEPGAGLRVTRFDGAYPVTADGQTLRINATYRAS